MIGILSFFLLLVVLVANIGHQKGEIDSTKALTRCSLNIEVDSVLFVYDASNKLKFEKTSASYIKLITVFSVSRERASLQVWYHTTRVHYERKKIQSRLTRVYPRFYSTILI